jgi:hypothetical protein
MTSSEIHPEKTLDPRAPAGVEVDPGSTRGVEIVRRNRPHTRTLRGAPAL